MTKKRVTSAECRCEFDAWVDGSVLKGTVRSGVNEFRTHLIIESPESDEDIARLIRLAKRGCFAEQLVQNPVRLKSTYQVNGREFEVDLEQEG
jgi:uncharacterized OsmC-like protein